MFCYAKVRRNNGTAKGIAEKVGKGTLISARKRNINLHKIEYKSFL
jgi:hypothetical protein